MDHFEEGGARLHKQIARHRLAFVFKDEGLGLKRAHQTVAVDEVVALLHRQRKHPTHALGYIILASSALIEIHWSPAALNLVIDARGKRHGSQMAPLDLLL